MGYNMSLKAAEKMTKLDLLDMGDNVQSGLIALRLIADADSSNYGFQHNEKEFAFNYVYEHVESLMGDLMNGLRANLLNPLQSEKNAE